MKNVTGFTYGNGTGALGACSFTQRGIMYVVGGDPFWVSDERQISILESCRLRKIHELPIDFIYGACNNFRDKNGKEKAFLCFGYPEMDGCLRYNLCLN